LKGYYDIPRSLDRPARMRLTDLLAELAAAGAVPNRPGPPGTSDLPSRVAGPAPSLHPPPPDDLRLWSALPALAEGHGVAALVAPTLAPLAPPDIARRLADAAERTLARGRRLAADVALVGDALAAAGIPYALLKGLGPAGRLYDPPAARPAADIDLLVRPGDVDAVARVLTSLGYEEDHRTWRHRVYVRPDNAAVVDRRGEHPDNPRPVEVHDWLGEAFRGITWDFTAAVALDHPGTELPAATAMAHLAAHATADALGRRLRLIQLADLARLARRMGEADWEDLAGLGGSRYAARFVWPALALADRVVGARIPMQEPTGIVEAMGHAVRPELRAWVDGVDLDALGYFGRDAARRAMGEIPAVWPISARERVMVWRFIMLPARWQLADRYPRLAGSWAWPWMYVRHGVYNAERLFHRARQLKSKS